MQDERCSFNESSWVYNPLGQEVKKEILVTHNNKPHNPGVTTMGNALRVSRKLFLPWCVVMLCSAVLFSGFAKKDPPPSNPVTAQDHTSLGVHLLLKGQCDDAIREFTQAIALDPNYTQAYLSRADAYGCTNLAVALSEWTNLIRLQPKGFAVYMLYLSRALTHNALGDVDSALADFDKAISLAPDRQQTCNLQLAKANALFTDGRSLEALAEYRALVKNLPRHASVAVAEMSTFLMFGALGVLLDSTGDIRAARLQKHATGYVQEKIQLCEAIVRLAKSHETPPAIVRGMRKDAVLQSVLVTDRLIGGNHIPVRTQAAKNIFETNFLEPECLVTVTKTGPLEDRTIKVLVFMDNRLRVEKQVPLKDVSVLPEVSRTQTLTNSGQPRAQVLESLRSTDKFIYEDDDFIVSFTEDLRVKDNRARVTMFRDGKLLISRIGVQPFYL